MCNDSYMYLHVFDTPVFILSFQLNSSLLSAETLSRLHSRVEKQSDRVKRLPTCQGIYRPSNSTSSSITSLPRHSQRDWIRKAMAMAGRARHLNRSLEQWFRRRIELGLHNGPPV